MRLPVSDGSPEPWITDMLLFRQLAEAGGAGPGIDRRYDPEQIVEAHRYVDTGHEQGNVALTVGHGA